MKLILSLSLIWMLSRTGGALQCVNQTGIECKSSDSCVAAVVQSSEQQLKHCGSSSLCKTNNQSQHISYNFGTRNLTAFVQCCDTDNCNKNISIYPDAQVDNNKTLKCFTCNGKSVCDETVQCVGIQKSCISGSVAKGNSTEKVYGCASKNLCELASELNFLPDWANNLKFTSGPKCCDTNMCNSAWTVTVNVVPVLLGLIMLIVW